MRRAGNLKRELSTRNQQIAVMSGPINELTAGEMPSVILDENRQPGISELSLHAYVREKGARLLEHDYLAPEFLIAAETIERWHHPLLLPH